MGPRLFSTLHYFYTPEEIEKEQKETVQTSVKSPWSQGDQGKNKNV